MAALDPGFLKVETTTKSGDVEFKNNASHNLTSQKLVGNVEVKYKLAEHGKLLSSLSDSLGDARNVQAVCAKVLSVLGLSSTALTLGITLTEKWNTDNVLGTVFEVKDQFAKGLKVTLDSSYTPHTAKRSGALKTEWSNDIAKVSFRVESRE